jgi:uncharacterized protein (DUF58 family)
VIVPTRRAVVLFACLAPVGLLGYATPFALDVLVLLNVGLLALILVDGRAAVAPARLDVVREGAESFTVGRTTQCAYRWHNPASREARLLVRESRPEIIGGVLPPRVLAVPAGGTARDGVSVTPKHRGREAGGWLAVRSRGPLGLAQRQGRVEVPWKVTVYPSLPASRLKASIAEAVRRRESGLATLRRPGEGRLFESLREWVPGDDTRHIDWKATARRRKVIARQFEEERRQQVMLVLDAGRLLTADVGGEARMEHVVRAALWLAFAANYHDDNVGLMVFADTVQHYVAPQRGRRGLRQVLDVLATTQPALVEPDYPAAFRYLAVRNRKRALTVFFTDVIDRFASEALVSHVGSLRPRHLPLVVTLRNPDLDRTAAGRPGEVTGAYRKAAAEELLAARGDALTDMRRAGAVVLDVPPESASRAVVEQYLELKRRGRL